MDRKNIDIYNRNAVSYSEQYDSVPFEQVHDQWLDSVELVSSGNALDIGSGSGRDAFALAQRGFDVVACEPAEKLLELAERNYPSPNITWLQDSLPSLNVIYNLDIKFDFILLSAVWMHRLRYFNYCFFRSNYFLIFNFFWITSKTGPYKPASFFLYFKFFIFAAS